MLSSSSRTIKILWTVMLLFFALLTWLSVGRYRAYVIAMEDLGNMAQAIWSATHGKPLLFTYFCHSVSRLGLHVELIYFLIAPIYALLPSPITLLALQTALFVAGAWPLYHLAQRHLESEGAALAIVLIYLLYPLAENAVLFDFHADTLAMPLFFFALEALDRECERAYFFWIALILISKVYTSYAVTLLGGLLFMQGKRSVGAWTIGVALAWGAFAFFIIRPWFATRYGLPVQSYNDYVAYYFGKTLTLLKETWAPRATMGIFILLPLLPVLPVAPQEILTVLASVMPVLLSSGQGPSYSFKHHHYALSVPFVIIALLTSTEQLRRRQWRLGRFYLWSLFLGTALSLVVGLNTLFSPTPLNPVFWRERRTYPDIWRYAHTERDALKDAFLSQISPHTTVFATYFLAPHLVNRETLCTPPPGTPLPPPGYEARLLEVDYAVFDLLFDYKASWPTTWLLSLPNTYLARYLPHAEWSVVAADDGLVLMQRDAPPQAQLPQMITHTVAAPSAAPQAEFGEGVALLGAEVEPLGERRFAWQITWLNETEGASRPRLFAVSRLVGPDETRVLHLPMTDLYPTTDWQAGEQITERFEAVLPDRLPPGSYEVWLGLYRMDDPFAYATDARSRVGDEVLIARIEVP